MNDPNNGQNWHRQRQYGYQGQGQYSTQGRQPMIMIPQRSQEDLSQFYNSQGHGVPLFPQHSPGHMQYHPPTQIPGQGHNFPPSMFQMQQGPSVDQHQAYYNDQMFRTNMTAGQHFYAPHTMHGVAASPGPLPPTILSSQPAQGDPRSSGYDPSNGLPPRKSSATQSQSERPQVTRINPSQIDPGQTKHIMANDLSSQSMKGKASDAVKASATTLPSKSINATASEVVKKSTTQPGTARKVPQVVIPAIKQSAASQFARAFQAPPKVQGLPKASSKIVSQKVEGPVEDQSEQRLVLLSLADQYISSARSMSSTLALSDSESDHAPYRELMTLGLSCLDSAIKGWRVGDTKSIVRLRLQYATLLFEETDNDDLAQSVLSHGITACERSRLTDQKCAMQHLLARIQFKTKPKAAFKIIDGALEDVTAYNNASWIYVFRLLRVALALQLQQNTEFQATLHQLKQLSQLAEARREIPFLVVAHVLEATVYIRSGHADSIEQAQRAIAAARTHQLDQSLSRIPQLKALILFTDLCCDLSIDKLDQLQAKVDTLQDFVDQLGANEKAWLSSSFNLPTSIPANDTVLEDTSGILRRTSDGKTSISFRWLNKIELFMLGFLLSGAARLQRNCVDDRAEQYLSEGISYAQKGSIEKSSIKSLESACAAVAREQSICLAMHICRIFAHVNRSGWTTAAKLLRNVNKTFSASTMASHGQSLQYLDAVIKQGTGDLTGALSIYMSADLLLPPSPTSKMSRSDLDLRLLATMNRILVLKSIGDSSESDPLMQQVMKVCEKHHSLAMQAAMSLLKAVSGTDLPVIELKRFLQSSLSMAQKAQNHQLIAILLNVMNVRFFSGIVGPQAEKSASVAWQLSRKMRSPLWTGVSGQNLANTLVLHGKNDEARKIRGEAEAVFAKLPEGIKGVDRRMD
ncbi:hypothetical protein CAC42_1270 [Sphaceloma murrayae]|uniref:MAU2 chromatid cohesion factor n=1 Tax=Sphaceloma murrayae TaxID=2082308 RepID=A0A2K1R2I1_9PEZI|nr:hypothetical protein CAC42_1270 [Sphaceloma murrayae]